MKLARFVLREDPGAVRTGVFHEQKIYETDGVNAIGVHDLSTIALLPPFGTPSSIRLVATEGFSYLNAGGLMGPLSEFDAPQGISLGVRLGLGAILRDSGEAIDPSEASDFIIGFAPVLHFVNLSASSEIEQNDLPVVAGPFLCTPEEFTTGSAQKTSLKIGGESVFENEVAFPDFASAICAASRHRKLSAGDLFLTELAVQKERSLLPGDSLHFTFGGVPPLVVKVV